MVLAIGADLVIVAKFQLLGNARICHVVVVHIGAIGEPAETHLFSRDTLAEYRDLGSTHSPIAEDVA